VMTTFSFLYKIVFEWKGNLSQSSNFYKVDNPTI
jgi:hypothetical protein